MEITSKRHSIRSNPVFWNPKHYEDGIGYHAPGTIQLVIYCHETFNRNEWDVSEGVFYFVREEDATFFRLKYMSK